MEPFEGDLESYPPAMRLRAFFNAMNKWEQEMVAFARRDWGEMEQEEYDQFMSNQKQKLIEVYTEHTVEQEGAQRFTEPLSYPSGWPVYGNDNEEILQIEADGVNARIRTNNHVVRFQYEYDLVLVDKDWRIKENRRSSAGPKTGWRDRPL